MNRQRAHLIALGLADWFLDEADDPRFYEINNIDEDRFDHCRDPFGLRPQDLCCEPVAQDREAFDALAYNQAFLNDWYMPEVTRMAELTLGPLTAGRKYCLKIPSALGGHYGCDNLATVPLSELIRFSGEGAQQFDGLPRWD